MGKGKTLRLLADSYDQAQEGHTTLAPKLKPIAKGTLFKARSDEEYEGLTESGAAVDPEKAREQELQDLERRRAALEAERERIDSELQAATPAEELKGKALDDALASAGLSTEGSAEEKRARLAAHQAESTPSA